MSLSKGFGEMGGRGRGTGKCDASMYEGKSDLDGDDNDAQTLASLGVSRVSVPPLSRRRGHGG